MAELKLAYSCRESEFSLLQPTGIDDDSIPVPIPDSIDRMIFPKPLQPFLQQGELLSLDE